jgi:hypothetical protein
MAGMVEALTQEECLSQLSQRQVGRVSVSKDALPLIVPVIYRQDGTDLILRAPMNTGFAQLCDLAVVAFETDGLCVTEGSGWSVHVVGVATIVDDGGAEIDRSVRLAVDRITGRRFAAASQPVAVT